MTSLTALRDRKRRTISALDPYMPRGLIMNLSKALKSTLVTDAKDPGHIVLMKRLRESCAMMTLSTTITESLVDGPSNASGKSSLPQPLLPDSLMRSNRRYMPLIFSAKSIGRLGGGVSGILL